MTDACCFISPTLACPPNIDFPALLQETIQRFAPEQEDSSPPTLDFFSMPWWALARYSGLTFAELLAEDYSAWGRHCHVSQPGLCLPDRVLCDGTDSCTGGEDEDGCPSEPAAMTTEGKRGNVSMALLSISMHTPCI